MSAPDDKVCACYLARELMKLPLAERNRILEQQAVRAEGYYRTDPTLTDFEALDNHDLYDVTP